MARAQSLPVATVLTTAARRPLRTITPMVLPWSLPAHRRKYRQWRHLDRCQSRPSSACAVRHLCSWGRGATTLRHAFNTYRESGHYRSHKRINQQVPMARQGRRCREYNVPDRVIHSEPGCLGTLPHLSGLLVWWTAGSVLVLCQKRPERVVGLGRTTRGNTQQSTSQLVFRMPETVTSPEPRSQDHVAHSHRTSKLWRSSVDKRQSLPMQEISHSLS